MAMAGRLIQTLFRQWAFYSDSGPMRIAITLQTTALMSWRRGMQRDNFHRPYSADKHNLPLVPQA